MVETKLNRQTFCNINVGFSKDCKNGKNSAIEGKASSERTILLLNSLLFYKLP